MFCVTAYPCVSTSVPSTYVWAFGFVGSKEISTRYKTGPSQSATRATQNDMTTCLETFEKERFCSFPHRHGINDATTARRRPDDDATSQSRRTRVQPPDYKWEPFATHSGKKPWFTVDFSQTKSGYPAPAAQVPTLGEAPSKRTDHSVVLFRDSLLVFGGFDGHNRRRMLRWCLVFFSVMRNFPSNCSVF